MAVEAREQMLQEAELATRFANIYRRQFAELIDRLNRNLSEPPDRNGLRLCVEAIDMMLATQTYLTKAIAQLGLAAEAPHPPEESGARQGQPVAAAAVPPAPHGRICPTVLQPSATRPAESTP